MDERRGRETHRYDGKTSSFETSEIRLWGIHLTPEFFENPVLDDRILAALFPLCGAIEMKNGEIGNYE
jgi:hypothetical protein